MTQLIVKNDTRSHIISNIFECYNIYTSCCFQYQFFVYKLLILTIKYIGSTSTKVYSKQFIYLCGVFLNNTPIQFFKNQYISSHHLLFLVNQLFIGPPPPTTAVTLSLVNGHNLLFC
jgi:hypothetical protein